ncbi:MAG TPA: peroxiredoxin [Gammaproteobacteria bacterium]|nr:peroxiredoxin [Gammaproteobacteria bacterium]
MGELVIGDPAPAFELPATGGKTISSRDMLGRNYVLYFYPRDNTPGCTTEGQEFRDHYQSFKAVHTEILGVSRDGVATHERFKEKHGFPFDLLSDLDETVCRRYGVIREKNMYGRKVMGIERSTFIIDREGILREAWRKVRVRGHVEEVLSSVQTLFL